MEEVLFKRKVVDEILKFLDSKQTLVIYGARQAGKTSLLKYLMKHHLKENAFYFDLEYQNLLDLCNEGDKAVYDYLLQKGADEKKKVFLIIDEIQYLENPSKFIKIFHDHYPNIKLLVSGSSTFEIKKKFKESLVGRTITFELYPLNFEEFLTFKGKSYNLIKENSKAINDELVFLAHEFIKFGGYPAIVLEKEEEKKKAYLFQIISTYIKKDIRDIGKIRNISTFNKLVEIVASQSGQLLNVAEIASTLGISRVTVLEYLDLLENTFVIRRIAPFHKNLRSELSKNPKIFMMDTGFMHLLWLKEFPEIVFGQAFETFVFLELMKAGKKISFWRTTNKQEIDFILPEKKLYAIEAKYSFGNVDAKTLKFFEENYKSKSATVGLKGEKRGKYIWELIKELENEVS
ncbi:MAG: ATP-binding protein [Candidatus Diapherotrites archaeon]|nr:ATP-binding protein [Candidatus Diapherotrites archaeon]